MRAIEGGELSAAKVLFGFGADLSIVDGEGQSLLHAAAEGGHDEAVIWLLHNSTIGINSTDNEGRTAVHLAMLNRHLDNVELLFERGALLSMVANNGRHNMLHIAANNGDVKAFNWVLENSTLDINSADRKGDTPMTLALKGGRLSSAKF
jgi:ankyrin repeat protein